MAAVSVLGTPTWTTAAGSKTVTTTPAVGDLIVVVASSSGLAGGTTAVSDDNSSGTYTQVDTDRTGFSTTGVLTVWVRDTLIGSAVSTVFTAAQVGSSGGGLIVFAVSGMVNTGAAAVRSNGGESTGGAGTTPAPVLSNTPLTYNPIITAVSNGTSGGGVTARGGYSDVAVAGYTNPATGLDACSLDSAETTATVTWGGTSATAFASVAIELDSPEPAAFIAEPIKTYFKISTRVRPAPIHSVLREPLPEEPPTPPAPDLSGENLAPVIYGYGAM